MKRTRLFLLLLLFFSTLLAQEKGKIRGGVDLSIDNSFIEIVEYSPIIERISKSYTLSLNYNLTNNMNIGLKYSNQTLLMYDNTLYYQSKYVPKDGNILLVDYNFYLHKKKWSISPFVNLGIGVLYFKSQDKYVETYSGSSGFYGNHYVFPKYTLSENIATGIEFNHIRLSIEYLFTLPKPTLNIFYYRMRNDERQQFIETWSKTNNVFLNLITLKLGFYIGGGSWKK